MVSGICATQVVQSVDQNLTITTLPRRSLVVICCPSSVVKVTSGILLPESAEHAASTSAVSSAEKRRHKRFMVVTQSNTPGSQAARAGATAHAPCDYCAGKAGTSA